MSLCHPRPRPPPTSVPLLRSEEPEVIAARVARLERQMGRAALWVAGLLFGWLAVVVYLAGLAWGAR